MRILVQEVKKKYVNSVFNFRRVTHFRLWLLETQVDTNVSWDCYIEDLLNSVTTSFLYWVSGVW